MFLEAGLVFLYAFTPHKRVAVGVSFEFGAVDVLGGEAYKAFLAHQTHNTWIRPFKRLLRNR